MNTNKNINKKDSDHDYKLDFNKIDQDHNEGKDNKADNDNNANIDNKSGKSRIFGLKKADWMLVGVLVLVILLSIIVIELFVKRKGSVVEIKVDGQVKQELSLDHDATITVHGYQGGDNVIVIENHTVRMTEADCPDKICVNTGTISKTGETIVCLPHRVVVEIKGHDEGVDSVVK